MDVWRLKITDQDFSELKNLVFADMPKEAGAFALAGVARQENLNEILIRRPLKIPKEYFRVQQNWRLEITPQAINGLTALCEGNGLGAVLCHSHPSDSSYSQSDDFGESRICETVRQFIPTNAPLASLLFTPQGVRGRVWLRGRPEPVPISETVVLGRCIKRLRRDPPDDSNGDKTEGTFDRQVRAFGVEGQRIISKSKVAIVGLGGTGSPTAEQLVRLGVQDLILIDPDHLSISSLSRTYGTFARDSQQRWWRFSAKAPQKITRLAQHLKRINPRAKVQAIGSNVIISDVAKRLLDRDVIFLCTDNHWSRAIVNQIAYQYFIPTINLGVRIDAPEQSIIGASGVVDILRPNNPCLWCSHFLKPERISAESMPKGIRATLEREGYVEGVDSVAPSVVSFTTTVAGMAVSLFVQLLTDFMGANAEIARLNYAILEGTVSRGRATIPTACDCKKVRGFGDLKPLRTLQNLDYLSV